MEKCIFFKYNKNIWISQGKINRIQEAVTTIIA